MNHHQTGKSSHTAVIMITLILVAGFIAYDYFATKSVKAQADPLLTSTANKTDSPFSPEQLALLAKIESINLDSSLFKNPVFVNLRDWTVELGHEDAGRPNPFIPIGGSAKSSSVKP